MVDSAELRMRCFGPRLPFTTRMTVIRLKGGRYPFTPPMVSPVLM
jgi:hypothetical protein